MKKTVSIFLGVLFSGLLLRHPQEAAEAAKQGLILCGTSVIPSLFPFLAAFGLLLKLGIGEYLGRYLGLLMRPLFRLRGICAVPLLTGLLGGYPAGASAAAELWREGTITREEAELLLGFCNNCGPAFLLGFVAPVVLQDPSLGPRLLLIHVSSALLAGFFLCRLVRRQAPAALPCSLPKKSPSPGTAFVQSVIDAGRAVLRICCFVLLFRVLAALLPLPFWLAGGLEMVTGLTALPPGPGAAPIVSAIVAWGGLSVLCQTMAVAEGLSMRWYCIGKLLQTGLALVLAVLFL